MLATINNRLSIRSTKQGVTVLMTNRGYNRIVFVQFMEPAHKVYLINKRFTVQYKILTFTRR